MEPEVLEYSSSMLAKRVYLVYQANQAMLAAKATTVIQTVAVELGYSNLILAVLVFYILTLLCLPNKNFLG